MSLTTLLWRLRYARMAMTSPMYLTRREAWAASAKAWAKDADKSPADSIRVAQAEAGMYP